MKTKSFLLALVLFALAIPYSSSQQIGYPDVLVTRAEKSLYTETTLSSEVSEFIKFLTGNCDFAVSETIGYTSEGRPLEIVIMADPAVRTPDEAKKSGKPVIYIQANIHAGEVEGKETSLEIMRDIAFGTRKDLLDNQILIFCPNYNPDGNDRLGNTRRSQEGSPELTGERASGEGYDLNREGMKAEAIEMKALLSKIIVPWDPLLLIDLHTDNGSWHGYAVSYAPSYISAGNSEPNNYLGEKLFPFVTHTVRKRSGIEAFWHGYLRMREGEPSTFTAYSHLPRYIVNYMGLRNRMAILSETFAHDRFEKRILSNYMLVTSILDYTNNHGKEMADLTRKADEETISMIKENAGNFSRGVRFDLSHEGDTIDMLIRETNVIEGTENSRRPRFEPTGKIMWTSNVLHLMNYDPVITSKVPRGYIYPAGLSGVTEKLEQHGIMLKRIDKKMKLSGDIFNIETFQRSDRESYGGHKTVSLDGEFREGSLSFPKGSIYVDMAQPLAWLIFYLLEPQSDDGLVFWNYFDDYLLSHKVEKGNLDFPVLKVYEPVN